MELAVLVPVLARPQNVVPLVESFLTGCPQDSKLYFITGGPTGDIEESRTIRDFGKPLCPERIEDWGFIDNDENGYGHAVVTWPSKINRGIATVEADWYLCAADDVTFESGWWDATKGLRDDPRIGVIGTNDSAAGTGNPRVAAGDHTCHPLLRGSYVRVAGTVDEPGKAVHEGYAHWCCDDELVATAKSRGAWAYCREAMIEHHHPYWQDGQGWDATYAKGEANAEVDMALWRQRAQLIG